MISVMTFNKKLFVTVGTTCFDKLIKNILDLPNLSALKRSNFLQIKLQVGSFNLNELAQILDEIDHQNMQIEFYSYKDSLSNDIEDADLVISHAGAGSCLEVLNMRKPLVVVINEDLMGNHQAELANQLAQDGYVFSCTCRNLHIILTKLDISKLKKFSKGDPQIFVNFLNNAMSNNS